MTLTKNPFPPQKSEKDISVHQHSSANICGKNKPLPPNRKVKKTSVFICVPFGKANSLTLIASLTPTSVDICGKKATCETQQRSEKNISVHQRLSANICGKNKPVKPNREVKKTSAFICGKKTPKILTNPPTRAYPPRYKNTILIVLHQGKFLKTPFTPNVSSPKFPKIIKTNLKTNP